MNTMAEGVTVVVCESCDREIEVCGFCGELCGVEICYSCTIKELKEFLPQPHGHGG
jgi:hypothetical protein